LPLKNLDVVDSYLFQLVAFTSSKNYYKQQGFSTETRAYPIRMAFFLSGFSGLLWLFSKKPRTGDQVKRKN